MHTLSSSYLLDYTVVFQMTGRGRDSDPNYLFGLSFSKATKPKYLPLDSDHECTGAYLTSRTGLCTRLLTALAACDLLLPLSYQQLGSKTSLNRSMIMKPKKRKTCWRRLISTMKKVILKRRFLAFLRELTMPGPQPVAQTLSVPIGYPKQQTKNLKRSLTIQILVSII